MKKEKIQAEFAIASREAEAYRQITEVFFSKLHDDAPYEVQMLWLGLCEQYKRKWEKAFQKELDLIREQIELCRDDKSAGDD